MKSDNLNGPEGLSEVLIKHHGSGEMELSFRVRYGDIWDDMSCASVSLRSGDDWDQIANRLVMCAKMLRRQGTRLYLQKQFKYYETNEGSAKIKEIMSKQVKYMDVVFRNMLESRWAAFFDIIGWQWEYDPCLINEKWTPSFRLEIPCSNSECNLTHMIMVDVTEGSEEYDESKYEYPYGIENNFDGTGLFGSTPENALWSMAHGSGGGIYSIPAFYEGDWASAWRKALQAITQN